MDRTTRPKRARGASAVEYVVTLVLIGIAAVAGYKRLSSQYKCAIASAVNIFGGGTPAACQGGGDQSAPLAYNDPAGNPDACRNGICLRPGRCFVAGTLVLTENGSQPIEAIQIGTRVLSRAEDGGAIDWKPVYRTHQSTSKYLVQLTVADASGTEETFALTANHPLYSEGRGWVETRTLDPEADVLRDADGNPLAVRAVLALPGEVPVYNLEVEDYRTYFVGQHRLWAHNGKPKGEGGSSTGGQQRKVHQHPYSHHPNTPFGGGPPNELSSDSESDAPGAHNDWSHLLDSDSDVEPDGQPNPLGNGPLSLPGPCARCENAIDPTLPGNGEKMCPICNENKLLCNKCIQKVKKRFQGCKACLEKKTKDAEANKEKTPLQQITSQVQTPTPFPQQKPDDPMIPNTVHFVWVGPQGSAPIDNMPDSYKDNINKTASQNPNHTIKVWTNQPPETSPWSKPNVQIVPINLDDLLNKTFKDDKSKNIWHEHYQTEGSIPNYAAQSDMLRVLILKSEGGIYSDTGNVTTDKPLPTNLKAPNGILVGTTEEMGATTNALMAAPPNSPFIEGFANDITRRLDEGFSGVSPDAYKAAVNDARNTIGGSVPLNDTINTLTGPQALLEYMDAATPSLINKPGPVPDATFPPDLITVKSDGSWLKPPTDSSKGEGTCG